MGILWHTNQYFHAREVIDNIYYITIKASGFHVGGIGCFCLKTCHFAICNVEKQGILVFYMLKNAKIFG